jgi:hypothetical protein
MIIGPSSSMHQPAGIKSALQNFQEQLISQPVNPKFSFKKRQIEADFHSKWQRGWSAPDADWFLWSKGGEHSAIIID